MPSTERTLRVESVVLRHTNWGEADRVVFLYSKEAGKLRAIAKGVRKLRSRKAGHLEPFTRVRLMLARGRDFWIITQAETVEAYLSLRDDLVRTAYAAYIIELVDRFIYEEGENQALYQLLIDSLQRVDTALDAFIPVRYFEIHFLDLLGFRPELHFCVRCENEIQPEDQYFSAAQGGVLCPRCGENFPGARPVNMNVLKYLRFFQRSAFREVSRTKIAPSLRSEMEALVNDYLTYLLERRLNSPAFLHEVRSQYEASQSAASADANTPG